MRRGNILSALAVFITAGCVLSGTAQQRMVADQVVAVVGNSMILLSDIEEMAINTEMERRANQVTSDRDARCEALETLLLQNMLANQARLDSLPENTTQVSNSVDNHIMRLIQHYGSTQAVEEAFHGKSISQIKLDFKSRYTDMDLAMQMQQSVQRKITITPSEVERFYNSLNKDSLPMEPVKYIYAHIVMYPGSAEDTKLRARERLLELRERAINGERFDLMAIAYSQDPGSASKGGEYRMTPAEFFVKPFAEALKKLRPGQISEVVETEHGFHIIQLISTTDNFYNLRHILIKPRFEPEELLEDRIKLDSIAREIRRDEISFEDAAAKYSDDSFSKYNGGLVTNHELIGYGYTQNTSTKFTRENLGKDYIYLTALRPGEVSDSYNTTDGKGNELTKIVMLKEVVPVHRANIREDYTNIENMALAAKQQKYYEQWLQKKIDAMYIRIDPRFVNCDFENKAWLK